MDLAILGLGVDDKGAIRTLNQFTGSAHNAGRAAENLERTMRRLSGTFGILTRLFTARMLIEYADTWTLIGARINIVSRNTERNNMIQEELFKIAQRTRNTMAATAVLYTRVALNADQLGRSHAELLKFVSGVNSAMLISGATGVEAAQSMRQLAQAMGAGRLQGDEFRTVMEAMPEVARTIADELGVTIGELYKLSSEGKIGVQTVLDAVIKRADKLQERAASIPMTVGQSVTYFMNAAERMIGILNTGAGITRHLADAIKYLANNMDDVVAVLGAATAAWIAYKVAVMTALFFTQLFTAWKTVQAILASAEAVTGLAKAMAIAGAASKGLAGIVPLLVAAVAGLAAYKFLVDEINKSMEEWLKNEGDLSEKLGKGTIPPDPAAERLAKRTREEIEDMIRLAEQENMLATVTGRSYERMQIMLEAVNKRVAAHRELTGDLLTEMLNAIDQEEVLKLRAEATRAQTEAEKKQFEKLVDILNRMGENLQRSFGDVFANIFEAGIDSFGGLFDAVKQLFFRMLADMLAAQLMQAVGEKLAAMVGGTWTKDGIVVPEKVHSDATLGAMINSKYGGAIKLPPLEVEVEESALKRAGKFIGVGFTSFLTGSSVGRMFDSTAGGSIAGGVSGAAMGAMMGSAIPGVGTLAGAGVGVLAGALGGLIGVTNKHREEMERHRATLTANNEKLQELRDNIAGRGLGVRLSEAQRAILFHESADERQRVLGPLTESERDREVARQANILFSIAKELGITLDGSKEAFNQLKEAVNLTIISLTQFGNNFEDLQSKQEAYNKIFDIEQSPQQALNDTYAILTQLAPELMREMGLQNLNLTSEAGRAVLTEGLKDIFNLIASGNLTPELLGAFTDKNQLLDAILRVKDAMNELAEVVFNVTTDFPRAVDIAFYEQKFGRFGTSFGADGVVHTGNPGEGGWRSGPIADQIVIVNEAGDTPERLVEKIEIGMQRRKARGGEVDLPV